MLFRSDHLNETTQCSGTLILWWQRSWWNSNGVISMEAPNEGGG